MISLSPHPHRHFCPKLLKGGASPHFMQRKMPKVPPIHHTVFPNNPWWPSSCICALSNPIFIRDCQSSFILFSSFHHISPAEESALWTWWCCYWLFVFFGEIIRHILKIPSSFSSHNFVVPLLSADFMPMKVRRVNCLIGQILHHTLIYCFAAAVLLLF